MAQAKPHVITRMCREHMKEDYLMSNGCQYKHVIHLPGKSSLKIEILPQNAGMLNYKPAGRSILPSVLTWYSEVKIYNYGSSEIESKIV